MSDRWVLADDDTVASFEQLNVKHGFRPSFSKNMFPVGRVRKIRAVGGLFFVFFPPNLI